MGGAVWSLSATDGSVRPRYPLLTPGKSKIIAPVTLADLTPDNPAYKDVGHGLHMIFATFDGKLYIVDGRMEDEEQPCVTKLDIDENIYSMILVEDVTGDGILDLIVGTMNGHVFCIGTETLARAEVQTGEHSNVHARELQASRERSMLISMEVRDGVGKFLPRADRPTLSSAVPFQYMGHNLGAVTRQRWHGIDVTARSRARHANGVFGRWVNIEFDIVDRRPRPLDGRTYDVTISLGMHFSRAEAGKTSSRGCLGARKAGQEEVRLVQKTFDQPGRHEMAVCLTRSGTYVLHITMLSDHGIASYSSTTVRYNHGFGDALQYGLVLPLLVAVVCVHFGSRSLSTARENVF